MSPPTPLPDEVNSTKPSTPTLDSLSSSDDSDSDAETNHNTQTKPSPQQTEWLATSRSKRSTAGNRMKALLANETPLTTSADADPDDLELLFAEDEDDAGFTDDAKEDASDVQMDSSSDEEDNNAANADEDEGEKELERQAREKRAAQRKRKAQEAIPAKFRKKVRIEPPGSSNAGSTVASPAPKPPRPKKKSERASWLPSLADMPTRASERSTTRMSKQQLHEKMVTDEIRRRKQLERMEKKAKLLEAMKKPPMTQAERLAEAAKVEKRNAKSLNRWEEAEKQREEERLRKIAALNSRKLDGPVVTFWSGIQELSEGQGKHVGNLVSMEERAPRKKRQSAAAVLAAKETGVGVEPGTPTTPVGGDKGKGEGEVKAEKVDDKALTGTTTVSTEVGNTGSTTAAPVNSRDAPAVGPSRASQPPSSAPATQPPVTMPVTPASVPISIPTPSVSSSSTSSPAPAAVSAAVLTSTPSTAAAQAPTPVPALGSFKPPMPTQPPAPISATVPATTPTLPPAPTFTSPVLATTSASPPLAVSAPAPLIALPTPPSMAPPPIPPPPEVRPPTSGVLAAPILAPPPGPMLGAQMPRLGFPLASGKSNVLALPNTSHTPSPLSMPPPAPAVRAPAPPQPMTAPTVSVPVPPSVPKLDIPPPLPLPPAQSRSTPAQTPVSATSVSATLISAAPVSATPTTANPPDAPQSALPQSISNPEPPQDQPQGKVTRSCIILQNFDDAAIKDKQIQNQILFGRKMNRLAKPAHPPLCVITNHPAKYRDPKTGLHYYNSYAYKEIQRVSRGDYKWSSLLGAYVGRGWGEFAAKGVPERFRDPSKPSGIVKKPEVAEASLVPIEGAEPVVKMEGVTEARLEPVEGVKETVVEGGAGRQQPVASPVGPATTVPAALPVNPPPTALPVNPPPTALPVNPPPTALPVNQPPTAVIMPGQNQPAQTQ
ncbi:YL1 nuclear protein-domain-containing protein [Triangularia setosa]|uniref:YL1 nuclear protein-domain-containing protein n=1 Tax=Triangularia setosa TaxID=2587417 RepID=A0AAN6W1L5_9PEZI|nr:YL1 nuclear protein-domain-containing protein [Podospora setosa]